MKIHVSLLCLAISSTILAADLQQSDDPPIIPVGLDAYRMWNRICYQRIGVRAYMRSTYDREGNNRSADASHFLYQQAEDFNCTLDVKGPGVLYFKRTNHWHGSPWHYEVDGNDFIVKETSTANPVHAKTKFQNTTYIPEDLFPNPLTWTWSITKGADLMWVPLPFEQSFRIGYSRTFYGTGYYIYHMLSPGMKHLSRPLAAWDRTPPDPEVLNLISKAGTDIAPNGLGIKTTEGSRGVPAHQWGTLEEIDRAPSEIRALKFKVARDDAYRFGKCRLRVTWDHRWFPSIDVPIDLFFGAGILHNNNDREYLVRGFPMVARYTKEHVELACYYPMPFFKHARIELENTSDEMLYFQYELRQEKYTDPINHVGYFHATYTDHREPRIGQDNVFLDTDQVEGGGPWSGNFVGMSWIFSRRGSLGTLEGDPRFFFDDSQTPQGWGTGTEEWGGGGDYWGGRNMTLPFAGHPVGKQLKEADDERDLINSAYRFLIADIFPFGRRAVIGLEHGGENQTTEHYSGVVYWYGMDSPTLVPTDHFHTCHEDDIKHHKYDSPSASEPYALVSRYEWGADHHGPKMHFPAQEDRTRTMTGVTTFIMGLDPNNLGVLLRRKFDYQYPNQCAKVSVRPLKSDQNWQYVGLWYTAGSNTCVYSYPRKEGELGEAQHNVITSNRRWREEEFLIPRHLTEGVHCLELRIEHVPVDTELYPGHPFPQKSAWSECRYWVYCYKMPRVNLAAAADGLAHEFLPYRFLREAKEYTADQPIEPLRQMYEGLQDHPKVRGDMVNRLKTRMALVEQRAGNSVKARELVESYVTPFLRSSMVDDIREVLGAYATREKNRPLLVASGDGSTKRTERDGKPCIVTQRGSHKPFIYLKWAEAAHLRDVERDVTLRITCWTDGSEGNSVLVEYNAKDDAYKDSKHIPLPTKKGWHDIEVQCPNAKFAGQQNSGADFRIAPAGKDEIYISDVQLAR